MVNSWVVPAAAALLVWGFWGFLPRLTVRYIDPRSAIVYQVAGAMLVAVWVLLSSRFGIKTHPIGIGLGMLTGVLGASGALFFLYAVERGPVALVATVSALYPVISVLLAVFLLQEALTYTQYLGIAFAILGIALIAK